MAPVKWRHIINIHNFPLRPIDPSDLARRMCKQWSSSNGIWRIIGQHLTVRAVQDAVTVAKYSCQITFPAQIFLSLPMFCETKPETPTGTTNRQQSRLWSTPRTRLLLPGTIVFRPAIARYVREIKVFSTTSSLFAINPIKRQWHSNSYHQLQISRHWALSLSVSVGFRGEKATPTRVSLRHTGWKVERNNLLPKTKATEAATAAGTEALFSSVQY